MNLKKYILPFIVLACFSIILNSCIRKEDTLPNINGIDNTSKFYISNYDENGLKSTTDFANATFQFGISEIFQIVTPGNIFEGKWKIESGKIIIKDIAVSPYTKLNNTWTWSTNNAYFIIASAPNGASTANITFTRIQ
jgi:hypothetical protein